MGWGISFFHGRPGDGKTIFRLFDISVKSEHVKYADLNGYILGRSPVSQRKSLKKVPNHKTSIFFGYLNANTCDQNISYTIEVCDFGDFVFVSIYYYFACEPPTIRLIDTYVKMTFGRTAKNHESLMRIVGSSNCKK